jgi:predicted Zn-dependent peptidase
VGKRAKFRKTVFDNGLTLISERHSQFESLAIGVWVKAGTRHELPSEAGCSHFLEHMLFKGTESRSALEIAREVDRVGGEFNAFTAREQTCFHILMLARDMALGLDILSDIILNSSFDPEELERERKVILQEIAMVEETPEELAHDLFSELLYGKHPLGKPILGSPTSIRRMKRADLLRFFRKHYRPEQLIVAVAGDVSHEAIKKRLRPLIRSKWPGRDNGGGRSRRPKAPHAAPAPAHLKEGAWWVKRPTEQVHLLWGVQAPAYRSRDRFALHVLNTHLGGGMSSVLFQEIREKNGLAYTVYSNLSMYADSGVFSIYAGTGMSQVNLCLKLIEDCVTKIKRELLTADELEAVKDNLKGTILLNSDSAESRMMSIANNEIYLGSSVSTDEVCKAIDAVTPEDVRRVARKLLRSDRRGLLAVGPAPSRAVRKKLRPRRLDR